MHRRADDRVKSYVERGYPNHVAVPSGDVVDELPADVADALWANNAEARIRFAEIALKHVLGAGLPERGPVHFVTITPKRFVREVGGEDTADLAEAARRRRDGDAARFDVRLLTGLVTAALAEIPFIGMVDVVLYARRGPDGASVRGHVSWHVHLLAWGAERADLARALDKIHAGGSNRSDVDAVDIRLNQSEQDLERRWVYSLKAPQKSKRVVVLPEGPDPETGEVRPERTREFKDWMQTGRRIWMLDVMAGRRLPELIFGTGEGAVIAGAIRTEARAPLLARQRQEDEAERARAHLRYNRNPARRGPGRR